MKVPDDEHYSHIRMEAKLAAVDVIAAQLSLAVFDSSGAQNWAQFQPYKNLRSLIDGKVWWAWVDLNHRPRPYQGRALAT